MSNILTKVGLKQETKNKKSLHELRINYTSDIEKYRQEFAKRGMQDLVDYFNKTDIEFNQIFLEATKSISKSVSINTINTIDIQPTKNDEDITKSIVNISHIDPESNL